MRGCVVVERADEAVALVIAGLAGWEKSLGSAWPSEEDDEQGAWIVGTVDEDGNSYPVISVEADQYDALGASERIARAIVALWSQAFAARPVQTAQHPVAMDATRAAKTLLEHEAKKYSLNAAGMFDSGAPEHRQTLAVVELLSCFDEDESEEKWEAIMAYADLRTSDALFQAAELIAAPIAQTEQHIQIAGQRLYDELRQWLATEHDPDSQAALQAWREAIAQTAPQAPLVARVAELEAELGQQHEAHRKTWRQLEQAQAELAALKAGGAAHG